jgi:hypothetical protein
MEEARREAMKNVTPYFVKDVRAKISQDIKEDPRKRTFVYETKDILLSPAGYSKGYFETACVNGSKKTPYLDELDLFARGFAESEQNQDYEIKIEKEGNVIVVDFQNVEKLAEEREKRNLEHEKTHSTKD